jgi:hypothetical protein
MPCIGDVTRRMAWVIVVLLKWGIKSRRPPPTCTSPQAQCPMHTADWTQGLGMTATRSGHAACAPFPSGSISTPGAACARCKLCTHPHIRRLTYKPAPVSCAQAGVSCRMAD